MHAAACTAASTAARPRAQKTVPDRLVGPARSSPHVHRQAWHWRSILGMPRHVRAPCCHNFQQVCQAAACLAERSSWSPPAAAQSLPTFAAFLPAVGQGGSRMRGTASKLCSRSSGSQQRGWPTLVCASRADPSVKKSSPYLRPMAVFWAMSSSISFNSASSTSLREPIVLST